MGFDGVLALRGRGTPPTKMVLRGSRGWDPSITKSLSLRFQGRICTWSKLPWTVNLLTNWNSFVTFSGMDLQACLWWWGWRHTGRASHPPPCRLQSEPALNSPPGTAGMRSLENRPLPSWTLQRHSSLHLRMQPRTVNLAMGSIIISQTQQQISASSSLQIHLLLIPFGGK